MTCIAALRTKKNVIVGGDSAGIRKDSLSIVSRSDPKVFQAGPFVIGYSGSFRAGQLLRFGSGGKQISKLRPTGEPFQFMVEKFVPCVREILKDGGFQPYDKTGCDFIVAYKRSVFAVENDFQVCEMQDDYTAVGCGDHLAIGSLFSSQGNPRNRVILALKAAERHSAGVRGPFTILET
jgi:ATP-dependent protease HslVU (ClpYQ) peptidase subunit